MLSIINCLVEDISGVQNMKQLLLLAFSGNLIMKLHPISGLQSLVNLRLTANKIRDVSPLASLYMTLEILELKMNQIDDVRPLATLINLTTLDLGENFIADFDALGTLVNLRALALGKNIVQSMFVVSKLVKLTHLDLSVNSLLYINELYCLVDLKLDYLAIDGNSGMIHPEVEPFLINSIPTLEQLQTSRGKTNVNRDIRKRMQDYNFSCFNPRKNHLASLDEQNILICTGKTKLCDVVEFKGYYFCSNIDSMGAIPQCINLESLKIEISKISDFSGLRSLQKLKRIDISYSPLYDISAFSALKALVGITIICCPIENIDSLADSTQVGVLVMTSCQISKIHALSSFNQLLCLNLNDNQIVDIAALARMINLQNLWLNDNKIRDITPVYKLFSLTRLELRNNEVYDITALSELEELTYLDLSNNNVTDISALINLTNLQCILLEKNRVSNIKLLAIMQDLEELNLLDNIIDDPLQFKNLAGLPIEILDIGGNPASSFEEVDNYLIVSIQSLNVLRTSKGFIILNDDIREKAMTSKFSVLIPGKRIEITVDTLAQFINDTIKQLPIQKLEYIGKGDNSIVYKCKHNGEIYALKEMKYSQELYDQIIEYYQIEHPGFIEIYDVRRDGDILQIVMELAECGNLLQYVHKLGGKTISKPVIWDIKSQLVSINQQLLLSDVIHRNINPENILVMKASSDKITVKLSPFAVNRDHYALKKIPEKIEELGYMAPELLNGGNYSFQSDMYSIGCVFYFLCTRQHPFQKTNNIQEVVRKKQASKHLTFNHSQFLGGFQNILSLATAWNPDLRATFSQFDKKTVNQISKELAQDIARVENFVVPVDLHIVPENRQLKQMTQVQQPIQELDLVVKQCGAFKCIQDDMLCMEKDLVIEQVQTQTIPEAPEQLQQFFDQVPQISEVQPKQAHMPEQIVNISSAQIEHIEQNVIPGTKTTPAVQQSIQPYIQPQLPEKQTVSPGTQQALPEQVYPLTTSAVPEQVQPYVIEQVQPQVPEIQPIVPVTQDPPEIPGIQPMIPGILAKLIDHEGKRTIHILSQQTQVDLQLLLADPSFKDAVQILSESPIFIPPNFSTINKISSFIIKSCCQETDVDLRKLKYLAYISIINVTGNGCFKKQGLLLNVKIVKSTVKFDFSDTTVTKLELDQVNIGQFIINDETEVAEAEYMNCKGVIANQEVAKKLQLD